MAKKNISWKTKGMNRDTSVSAFNAEFAFENVNLRLATNEGNTMMSWVNERGTSEMSVHIALTPWNADTEYSDSLQGTPIGTAVLNHKLVVFTTGSEDCIYVLEEATDEGYDFTGKLLYKGNLGFNTGHPLETLVSYESESVQKVYWTDNLNQPRVINIAPSMDSKARNYNDGSFDFVRELALQEEVTVTKMLGTGEFPAGVIQYAFTYYNKYGQESNIFYTTPLQYITYVDRGGSAESKIANAFKIMIRNLDANFDYLRIYSILRTSKDATPLVKRVEDVLLSKPSETVFVKSAWGFNKGLGNKQDSAVEMSLDGGITYQEPDYKYSYTDPGCPKPQNSHCKSRAYWEALEGGTADVYVFDRAIYPDLILRITTNGTPFYYTWGEDSVEDARIYLGLGDGIGILVSENVDEGEVAVGSKVSPVCKYSSLAVSYLYFIDDGTKGDTVDPTELLYKGGEEIKAKTMEQKDNTLFLGDLTVTRPYLTGIDEILLGGASKKTPLKNDNITACQEERFYSKTTVNPFVFVNTLDSSNTNYQGAACFKSNEYYRLGVQFQYKNGKWSEPFWIGDKQCDAVPSMTLEEYGRLSVPEFRYTMPDIFSTLYSQGYRKARPVFAVPKVSDRTILCQGVGCPTMYRKADRYSDAEKNESNNLWNGTKEGTLYAQSSWLFRTPVASYDNADASNGGGIVSGDGRLDSHFDIMYIAAGSSTGEESDYLKVMSPYLRNTEVMGIYDDGHAFYVDDMLATVHSPELVFDDSFTGIDFSAYSMNYVGGVLLNSTYGDIDIQVSTPPISSSAAGFEHRSIVTDASAALISGLFFNDKIVDDLDGPKYQAYDQMKVPVDFPVFMWHKNGSLNNDVARDNRSAELLKKKISNYRLSLSTVYNKTAKVSSYDVDDIQLFNSDVLSVIKVAGHVYMGNIETMLTPTSPTVYPIVGNPWRSAEDINDTDFNSDSYYFLGQSDPNNSDSKRGIWNWIKGGGGWNFYRSTKQSSDIGDIVSGLTQWREPISMKYKSTPHLVVKLTDGSSSSFGNLRTNSIFNANQLAATNDTMPLVEITKAYNQDTFMGGTSDEVFQAATWIPCGPPVAFDGNTKSLTLEYKWGDTYFQRFECLKTYPYTQEDKNQVVEIASFMVETRVNIDGRYDRNRAQVSNLNMTPQNFNLLNPVYSQMDNFFSYKMLDKSYYENTDFPNNITWTKTKESGADIDLWTNITLASTLEMDGNKGEINKIARLNDQLIAFQDSGIAQILYNENTQISTTEGVPIEIANSGKVQGKRYYSDTIGCSNKWSVVTTPNGIYFMDSNDKSIYLFNGQLNNLTTAGGFNSWAKENIASADKHWSPDGFNATVTYYDRLNQDVLFINKYKALAYSEKFNCFTSFYDYGGAPYFNSLDDMGLWIDNAGKVWRHQAGEYCCFFGESKLYSMTLIANQEPQLDKIFTNLEFRACVTGDGNYDEDNDKLTPFLPFDSLEAWNEHQHGKLALENKNGHDIFTHGKDSGSLTRKFRIWRCDIPRNNIGGAGFKPKPLDRIRNPWAYLKLTKDAAREGNLGKVEIHDIMATYFG